MDLSTKLRGMWGVGRFFVELLAHSDVEWLITERINSMRSKRSSFLYAIALFALGGASAMAQTSGAGAPSGAASPATAGTAAGGVAGSNAGPGPVGNGANPPSSLSPVTGQPTTTDPNPPRAGQPSSTAPR